MVFSRASGVVVPGRKSLICFMQMIAFCFLELIWRSVQISVVFWRGIFWASGQLVNFRKSAVCFSKQISGARRRSLATVLNMVTVDCHESYLGLPYVSNRSKKVMFDKDKQRV